MEFQQEALEDAHEFNHDLLCFFNDFNCLMAETSPTLIGAQTLALKVHLSLYLSLFLQSLSLSLTRAFIEFRIMVCRYRTDIEYRTGHSIGM